MLRGWLWLGQPRQGKARAEQLLRSEPAVLKSDSGGRKWQNRVCYHRLSISAQTPCSLPLAFQTSHGARGIVCDPCNTTGEESKVQRTKGRAPGHCTPKEFEPGSTARVSEHPGKPTLLWVTHGPPRLLLQLTHFPGAETLVFKSRILSKLFKGQKPFNGSGFGCFMKNGTDHPW